MKPNTPPIALAIVLLVAAFGPSSVLAQPATLQGTVTDAESGEALLGANVLVVNPGTETMATMSAGAATGLDGSYTITGIPPGTYELLVQYVGYSDLREAVTLAPGETLTRNLELSAGLDLGTITVESVGRRQEKVLDAPAAVTVLGPEEIETQATSSPAAVLRNTTGVDMSQMGVDRYDIALRGFNNAFSGSIYTLTDYRQAAVPSLAVNAYSIMPISNIDLDRIEVVRGPASALYGPGVDAGVVHFFSKDPFSYPGTTVAVLGGERSTAGVNFRHAGVVGEKFGYKFTGQYFQAEDWAFDPDDPDDAGQLDDFAVEREDDVERMGLNGSFEYRFNESTSLTANVGYNQATSTFYTGIGTVQGVGFSYTYAQLRLQSGRLFAQSYINSNDHGDSFVYGTGDDIFDNSSQINAQAQYMVIDTDRQNLIVGVDADWNTPRTAGTIYGRNEGDDAINEYGAYGQSLTRLGDKIDLTLAARLDYNNVQEEFFLSPRAAVVYKASPRHSLRATYNRAFSSPGNNSQFLDIVAGQIPGTPIAIRGRGAAFGFSFPRNPDFASIAGTDLVMTSLVPSAFNQPSPAGLPLGPTYAQVHAGLSDLAQNNPQVLIDALAAAGLQVPPGLVPTLVALLDPQLTTVQGFSQGRLGLLNLGTNGIDPIQNIEDIDPLRRTTTQIVEAGYKGILNDRILLAVDGYWARQEDFVGPLLVETPFVLVPNLASDLTAALAVGIAGNNLLSGALAGLDVTPAQAAALIIGFAADQLPSASTPIGIVQPNENMGANAPELMLSYRNFGEVTYYGVDVTTQVQLSPELSAFGSLSWVSDDFFTGEEIGEEEGSDLAVALNAPAFKFKLGGAYYQDGGLSVNVSGRYVDGFPVESGPYVGEVPSFFLLDLGLGYDFSDAVEGLRLDVLAQNVFDNVHREFVGVPQLGRYTTARLTFSF